MGSATWAPRMESWIGCAICGQRERPPSRVGVVRKRSTQENCPKARRPSFCEKTSKAATLSLATLASQRTRHLRSLSVLRSAIQCLCWKGNSADGQPSSVCDTDKQTHVEIQFHQIAVREPNLDEIFLRLTGTALRD